MCEKAEKTDDLPVIGPQVGSARGQIEMSEDFDESLELVPQAKVAETKGLSELSAMNRLPILPKSTDSGYVYVLKRGNAYKIGFSRRSVVRRARDNKAELVLTIPTGQRPSVLEHLLNAKFASKRLSAQGNKPGDKREWFALDESDLDWLRGMPRWIDRWSYSS